MAAFEEAKEESGTSDVKAETTNKRLLVYSENSELDDLGDRINQTDVAMHKKLALVASKSVPTFDNLSKNDSLESDYGSESDLKNLTINETSLLFSQSYQTNGERNKLSGIHKVQFKDSANPDGHAYNEVTKKSPKKKGESQKMSDSSGSLGSIHSNSSSNTNYSIVTPDGGYGWVVVAASFFVNMIADGVTFSFGIMFEQFQDDFGSSSAATAGVVSMFHAVPLMTGPIATWLTDRYGCKAVTIVGAILAAAGFLMAAFSHHIGLLYLFFGVVAGFGLSLCYVASIIIVAYYFDRRRSFATGISVCGSGVGTFLFAPFTQWLMDSYGGWREACIILAGIFLNMIVCGMLFKELNVNRRNKQSHTSSARSSFSQMPEIEELRIALESGDVSTLLQQEKVDETLASSLITIPTYIKDASKLPEDVLTKLVQSKKAYDYIVQNFPESLIAQSLNNIEEENAKDGSIKEEQIKIDDDESAGLKLKRRMSSLLKGQKPNIKHREKETLQVQNTQEPLLSETNTLMTSSFKEERPMPEDRAQRLHFLKIRRQSMTYRRACLSTPRYHMKASSCPDIYKNTIVDDDQKEAGCAAEISRSMTKCCSLNYIKVPFVVFCISNFLLYFWYDVPYVYTIEYAENFLNVPNSESAQILSIIGVLNTIGEVLVGWLSDQPWMSSLTLYAVCMCVCGIVTALIPFVKSYSLILVLSAFYGLCISANYSLTSPILVDLVSIEQFSSAYGLLLACQGIGNLVGPPFAGWLYDVSLQWFLTFGFAGFFIAGSGVMLVLIPSVKLLKRCLKKVNTTKRFSSEEVHQSKEVDKCLGEPQIV